MPDDLAAAALPALRERVKEVDAPSLFSRRMVHSRNDLKTLEK